MTANARQPASSIACLGLSFRTGMALTLLWGLFWMWCWYHTCAFLWTGEYHPFFNELPFTQHAHIVVPCAALSAIQPVLFGLWLAPYPGDGEWTRRGLVAGSVILLLIAVVFTVGGVYVMAIDVLAMGYVTRQTWRYYQENKLRRDMKSKATHFL